MIRDVSYSFVGGGAPSFLQEELVRDAIAEYTRYANVNLVPASKDHNDPADIRISFKNTEFVWSAIGTNALEIKTGATMRLAFLPRDLRTKDRDALYNHTLHQFGHAFGLAHEWDCEWATITGGTADEAIIQHKAAFPHHSTSNFPEPDKDPIMKCVRHLFNASFSYVTIRLIVPGTYTNNDKAVTREGGLSDKDKAWLTLIYPGKAGGDEETRILRPSKISKSLLKNRLEFSLALLFRRCGFIFMSTFQGHTRIDWVSGCRTPVLQPLKILQAPRLSRPPSAF